MRNETINRILAVTNSVTEWAFFDSDGDILRDAIKIRNFPKIEIYHHSFAGFEYALQNLSKQEGLEYSISKRLPLLLQPDMEFFIDSYIPNKQKKKQDLLFEIMTDHQTNTVTDKTFKNIVRLFAINTYDGIPAQKHWSKFAQSMPHSELLLAGQYAEWIQQCLELLTSWGQISPQAQLSGRAGFSLEKQNPQAAHDVFEKVTEQKERLQTYLSWPQHIKTPEDQENFYQKASIHWSKGQAFHFQISCHGNFAGAISIHSLNHQERSFEFGYWVDQAEEGKGFVTQGLHLLINDMRDRGWRKAKIRTLHDNVKSKRVAERLGMTVEMSSGRYATYSILL